MTINFEKFDGRVRLIRLGLVMLLMPVVFLTVGLLSLFSDSFFIVGVFFTPVGFYFTYKAYKSRKTIWSLLRG